MRILVVNGPNLNLLGKREMAMYGKTTLWDIENRLKKKFPKVKFEFYQSNSEGAIVDMIQRGMDNAFDSMVINPGAYGHYSYAIRDAIAALKIPVVEVHLTNVHAREEFRHRLVLTEVCKGIIAVGSAVSS
ncbi:MAG: 3-dehydroquinate dehydratase [Ignavibacteriales bacterium]|nr:3-dehydroquinate dehydratase [Ignavibacteriales bacterium]